MIRINLSSLAPAKGKRGGRQAPTLSIPGEGPSSTILVVIVAVVALASMYLAHVFVDRQKQSLEENLRRVTEENRKLSEVKAQYEASKRQADLYQRRVKVIDDLKAAQQGPVNMLNVVADTVNKTDAVWLETMTNDGKSLNFTGLALSADAVADLMANLRKTGMFKSVEIKETSQDSAVKEVQAFKFELICEIGFSSKVQKQS
jgi:type IV pilus assembly protein PilN